MRDPNLALWLYIAIVAMQVFFSKRWGAFYAAIAEAGKSKVEATGNTQDSGAGQHGL